MSFFAFSSVIYGILDIEFGLALDNFLAVGDITIRGTSGGLYIEDNFAVTVKPVDDPPFVANAIIDIALDINTETHEIDLTNVFADIDNSNIAKTILNNTNSNFVTAAITENNLIISHQAGVEGETQITVQGLSNGIAVEDTFNVYAYESYLAPQIAEAIENITVVENSASTAIDLASVFTDPDNDDLSIAKWFSAIRMIHWSLLQYQAIS